MAWVGRTLRPSSSNPPATSRNKFLQLRLPRAPSNLALSTSRDGAPTASLGSLCQCLTTLWVNNFFLTAYLNLPSTQYHSAARGTLIYPQDPAGDADFGKPWDLQLAGLRAQGGQTQPSVTPALLQRCVQARF